MIELVLLAVGLMMAGGKKSDASSSGGVSESSCEIGVEVDARKLSICRSGARWRMFIDGALDPRTFFDLPGVLQRAIKETDPASAQRVKISTKRGSGEIVANDTRDAFMWKLELVGDGPEPQTLAGSTPEPTMLDALGKLYHATPSGFFN